MGWIILVGKNLYSTIVVSERVLLENIKSTITITFWVDGQLYIFNCQGSAHDSANGSQICLPFLQLHAERNNKIMLCMTIINTSTLFAIIGTWVF